MNVTLVARSDSRSTGGSLRVLETISKGLQGKLDLLVVFAYGPPAFVSNQLSCSVVNLRATSCLDVVSIVRLFLFFRQTNSDIVHFVDQINWMILVCIIAKQRYIIHSHGRLNWRFLPLWEKIVTRFVHYFSSGSICISHAAKLSLVSRNIYKSSQVKVLYNCIDFAFANLMATRSAFSCLPNSIKIGMACRLVNGKGVSDAIRIMKFLPEQFSLILAGVGPQEQDLIALSDAYGLSRRVQFLGTVTDMHKFYDGIDIYLFASRYEPFGLVAAEAMSLGVPLFVIASDGEYMEPLRPLIDPTVADVVWRDDIYSYDDISLDKAEAVAKSLVSLASNPLRQKRISQGAYQRIASSFMPSSYIQDLISIYASFPRWGRFRFSI